MNRRKAMILFRINNFHSQVAILGTVAEPFQNLSNHFKASFLDRDHAVLTDLLHRLGDDVADGRVAVGGNHARPARSCRL